MLTFASLANDGVGVMMATPEFIALTPHHFTTLNSNNNVRFIQEEWVDWVSVTQNSLADFDVQHCEVQSPQSSIAGAELITDIRRPDQIWGLSLVSISSSNEHLGWYGREYRETNLTRSEEKQIKSQFEHAKSLCTNPVRMFMDRLMLNGLVILTLPFCWILLQAQKAP